ncbi:hypothetical protein HMPREF1544_06562 [Mucor circinelloides 1006PhL]|uniref:Uncharacterized protein n=1 Tax=Mucor circinelloides f. circinelloides (strain 1006PhL) TaxID=1220926 RepID=S2JDX9_MUCC1|nr:hypothetical protein HMPREF1544_06562 [Mucor circinelloides 1006PhL]
MALRANKLVFAFLEGYCYLNNRKLLPQRFYSPNNTFCHYIQQTCVSALRKRCYNIFAGSSKEKMKLSVAPLMMHIVTTHGGDKPNHWVTMKLKRSIKLKWPTIDKLYRKAATMTLVKYSLKDKNAYKAVECCSALVPGGDKPTLRNLASFL